MEIVDIAFERRMNRMRRLAIRCHSLTASELQELVMLRFDSEQPKNLKRFMLRVHSDKVGNDDSTPHLWLEAIRSAEVALRASPGDFQDALRRLATALEPLHDVDTPAPLAEPGQESSGQDSDEECESTEESLVMMPTACIACQQPAEISSVLGAAKYATDAGQRMLSHHEWQHACCAAKQRMPRRPRLGNKGLEGTMRSAKRGCFVDSVTGTEIRARAHRARQKW